MEKLMQERNRLAKQIYVKKKKTAAGSVNMANELMSALYGEKWNEEPPCDLHHEEERVKSGSDDGISIHADSDGVKWVRVKIFDEDFLIAAKDYEEEGETYFSWNKAVEIGTFSKKQAYLIAAYKDEINKLLEEIGGDPLASDYWSSTEYSAYLAWGVNFSNGGVYSGSKCSSFVVRPCAAFKS